MTLDRTRPLIDQLPYPFIPMAKVASVLGVSEQTARKAANRGQFPCVRVGVKYRVPTRAFVQWVETGEMEGAA